MRRAKNRSPQAIPNYTADWQHAARASCNFSFQKVREIENRASIRNSLSGMIRCVELPQSLLEL